MSVQQIISLVKVQQFFNLLKMLQPTRFQFYFTILSFSHFILH